MPVPSQLIGDTPTLIPIGLWAGIHFGKMLHTHVRKGPRAGQAWKKKPGLAKDKPGPGRTALYKWLNSLFAALFLISGDAHTLSLWGYVFLPCLYLNKLFLCVLYHLLCLPLIINFAPVFTVFASLKYSCFQMEATAGKICFQPLALAGLVARIPGSHPGSVQFSRSVVSDSFRPHEPQHATSPCPSPTPGVYSNSCPFSQ